MELARLKNLEEFDGNSKKKWRNMDNEIEKYRKKYFDLRKSHEELMSETSRLVCVYFA